MGSEQPQKVLLTFENKIACTKHYIECRASQTLRLLDDDQAWARISQPHHVIRIVRIPLRQFWLGTL